MRHTVIMGEERTLRTRGSILGTEVAVLRIFTVFLTSSRQVVR
jgi:hypothetical protein